MAARIAPCERPCSLALWPAYAASPFVGVYRLVEVVGQRDVLALPERVDFLALRGSLSTQIARTYLRIYRQGRRPRFIKTVADAVAAPIVAELVSPEHLLELLQTGRPVDIVPNTPPMPGGLSRQSLENTWRAYLNSELGIGPLLNVSVDKPRAPSSTILSAQLDLEAVRHRAAAVAAGGLGLTIAALMADSGARQLRACGGGNELDDQRTAVQRPRRSVDSNLS